MSRLLKLEYGFEEMIQLMLLDDTDSGDVARGLIYVIMIYICVAMMMLPVELFVCVQDHFLQYLPS
jgi:hypothetical protein